jgi:hypothetical protein
MRLLGHLSNSNEYTFVLNYQIEMWVLTSATDKKTSLAEPANPMCKNDFSSAILKQFTGLN